MLSPSKPESFRLSLSAIGCSSLPGLTVTLHMKQAALPPQRVRIGILARLAASNSVVPGLTLIVRPDGQNVTSPSITSHLPL